MKRTQEDAEKTRQAILDAGIQVFIKKGYNHTSMDDISKVAHVTRGAIYWHFKNKEDLLVTMANSIYVETADMVNIFFSQGTTLFDKITNTMKHIGYWYLEDTQVCLKRNVLTSILIGQNQTLLDRIFQSIYPEEVLPSDEGFIAFIADKLKKHFSITGIDKASPEEVQEGFLLIISFMEGFISIIIKGRDMMTRNTIDNIVNKFLEGFFHSFKHILEAK